jgi:hypothetical protein
LAKYLPEEHVDYASLQEAMQLLKGLVDAANEGKRSADHVISVGVQFQEQVCSLSVCRVMVDRQ